MRKIAFGAVAAAAAMIIAVPASADEIRAEVRGGAFFGNDTEVTVGIAGGYDQALGNQAFVGGEVSMDKLLVRGADIYLGLTGRIGAYISPEGRAFIAGGHTFAAGEDVWHLGAGYEHSLGGNLYLKGEYRHFFGDWNDGDQLVAGVGLRF